MTNQTHLLRRLDRGRSDEATTPGTNDFIGRGFDVVYDLIGLGIDAFTQMNPS